MSNILYAPIIGETIPGFVVGGNIRVPFQMNSAVGSAEVSGFALKVSDFNGTYLNTLEKLRPEEGWDQIIKDGILIFENSNIINFNPGQYYKFQLAYIAIDEEQDEKESRKYSYISIGKCVGEENSFEVRIEIPLTTEPDVIIPSDSVQWGPKDSSKPKERLSTPFPFKSKRYGKIEFDFTNSSLDTTKIKAVSCFWYDESQHLDNLRKDYPFKEDYLEDFNKNIPPNTNEARIRIFAEEDIDNPPICNIWFSNYNIFNYEGQFIRASANEPLYSYRYDFKDEFGQMIQTTGDIIWNVKNDKLNEDGKYYSDLPFNLTQRLQKDTLYTLQLFCTTINGYEISSPVYEIIKEKEVEWESSVLDKFEVFQDYIGKENGYIQFDAVFKKGGINKVKLERQEDDGPYQTVYTFDIKQPGPFKISWKDQAIKQGVNYKYALRYWVEEKQCWTTRKERGPIFVDFDHVFLSDSERQLKIKFDPKVSSFRDTLLEQKTDTIGSRYPFFFRNNQIKYKEIPISGLISYHMDNDEFFMKQKDLGLNKIQNRNSTAAAGSYDSDPETEKPKISTPATTDLVDYNIAAERKFKLEVLDWLNNGKPKLFRSPTEGNYVIRLMNVSLSPNDTLGRAIHSFSATGYECMNNDPQTLMKNGLLGYKETDITSIPIANLGLLTLGVAQLGQGWAQKEGTNNEQ